MMLPQTHHSHGVSPFSWETGSDGWGLHLHHMSFSNSWTAASFGVTTPFPLHVRQVRSLTLSFSSPGASYDLNGDRLAPFAHGALGRHRSWEYAPAFPLQKRRSGLLVEPGGRRRDGPPIEPLLLGAEALGDEIDAGAGPQRLEEGLDPALEQVLEL